MPGLLFRGGTVVPPPVVEIDAALPTGHRAGWRNRPDRAEKPGTSRTCASDFPVCVHGPEESERVTVLALFARAYRTWSYVLSQPPPLPDGTFGGGPEFDVYLKQDIALGGGYAGVQAFLDPPLLRSDRTSAWCAVDPQLLTERTAALCIGEASVAGIDAAIGPSMRRGWASHQAGLAYPPEVSTLRALEDAQRQPFRPPLTREVTPWSEASAGFWGFLDEGWRAGAPGELPLTLVHLSAAAAPRTLAHPEWFNVPDELDVLRHAFDNDGTKTADFWSDWGVVRAFWGNRSDGAHSPELRWGGQAGSVAFDWVLDYSSLPRHLAGPNPVYPLGSAYVWVELDSVPLHATLAFRAEWEQPVAFTWVVLAVDAQGCEQNRWRLPYVERANSAETTIVNFEGAAGLLLVGTNLGAIDVSHPFDPDQEPWEAHAYSVYLTQLSP